MGNGTNLARAEGAQALRHFVRREKRPPELGEVGLVEMDPLLRGLLFTDGTVTRTLEVQWLCHISVEVLAQGTAEASAQTAAHLDTSAGAETVRRRVVIGGGELASPLIWAESHILPGRLPEQFLSVLDAAPDGIGESLQQVQLESWRELLWFGLDTPPRWSNTHTQQGPTAITRLYRVITAGRPALLISESFAVIRRDGVYCLDCLS